MPRKPGLQTPSEESSPSPTPFRYRAVPAHGMRSGPWTAPKDMPSRSRLPRSHSLPQVSTSEPSPQARRADTHRSRCSSATLVDTGSISSDGKSIKGTTCHAPETGNRSHIPSQRRDTTTSMQFPSTGVGKKDHRNP
ncbi:MAG: hypothetical protein WCY33_01675 [Clostridia bacterium]